MTFEKVISRFEVKSRYKNRVQAVCPAHDDKQASLSISRGRTGALLHCHAGCSLESILDSVELKKSDLFYLDKPQGSSWKRYIESREKRRIEAAYNYVSLNGDYLYTKIRLEGKKLLYGILKNDRFQYGLQGRNRRELKALYFNPQALKKAIEEGKTIFIPEGEKDVDSLRKRGYVALTYGGVNDWQSDFKEILRGANVAILADNDVPGINVAKRIEADLKGIAQSVKLIIPTTNLPKGDISDYFEEGHSNGEFERMINETAVTDITIGDSVPKGVFLNLDDVRQMLMYKVEYDKDGNEKSRKLIQSVKNFEIVLENDSRLKGKIKFDEFSQQTFLMGNTPWEKSRNNYRAWSSFDDSALFSVLQSDYGLNNRNDYFDALKNVAMRNKFHPVRDLLNSLQWDGQEHIKGLLPDYLGAEDTELSLIHI